MTTKAFAELILELLGRNTQDFKIDERIIVQTAQKVVTSAIAEKMKNQQSLPGSFYLPYTFQVKTDTRRQLKYIEPYPGWLQIEDAFAYIGYPGERESFILLQAAQFANYSRLEAGQLGGRVGAKPEGKKIYLYNAPDLLEEVFMLYVPQLGDLDEDAEMFSDAELDQYVIENTINLLRIKDQKPEDKLTDNISN